MTNNLFMIRNSGYNLKITKKMFNIIVIQNFLHDLSLFIQQKLFTMMEKIMTMIIYYVSIKLLEAKSVFPWSSTAFIKLGHDT